MKFETTNLVWVPGMYNEYQMGESDLVDGEWESEADMIEACRQLYANDEIIDVEAGNLPSGVVYPTVRAGRGHYYAHVFRDGHIQYFAVEEVNE